MMSSSDKTEKKEPKGWQPLVPAQLEHCEIDPDMIDKRKDPELERRFQALYEQHRLEKRKFSLLYADSESDTDEEEDDSTDEDSGDEDTEPEIEEDPPPDYEAIRREAYDEGYANGEKEGYEAGVAAASEKTERLETLISEIETFWRDLIHSGEEQIIDLVARVSEKVVYGSVSVDNEIITRAIMDVFEKIPDPVEATITVNPLDYDYIEVVKDDFFECIKGLKQVRIVSDQLIAPGGCRIETKAGEVDTSIEERLEAVKRSIISASAIP